MTHAEVRERLADALLDPGAGGIEAVLHDPGHEGVALRAHLVACAACAHEAAALQATAVLLAAGAPDSLRPSADVRARTLQAARASRVRASRVHASRVHASRVHASERPSPAARWRFARPSALTTIAAALVLAVALAGIAGGVILSRQRDEARQQLAELRTLSASSQALLADPAAIRLALAGPAASGTVALSPATGQLVVIATGLPTLAGAGRYECFLERGGQRTMIGWMETSAELAWWAGPIAWLDSPGQAGDRFLVLAGGSGDPVLSGQF
ncbi:MAG: hypothetical protein ACHQ15_06950 [Candidatus Limnocylindrales bacterium]